jgi:transcriptional antiterminator RfaH
MNLHFYLPLIAKTTRYGRRKIISELPLFPGYLFLHGTREQAFSADRTRRVAQIIDVPDQDELWRELAAIRRALTVETRLDPYPYLKVGVRVSVRSGPLQGLEGVVEDRTRMDRLILRVRTLGQAVAMEIDAALLEPME